MDLAKLNPPQREAVLTLDGPVLVLAGAGSGKTMVITWRCATLLERGVAPEQILAVTFTNKAAREMRERLGRLLPALEPGRLTLSTFHSFCCGVLRRHIKLLGYTSKFGIADDGDQLGVIKQAMGELGLEGQGEGAEQYRTGLSKFKSELKTPDEVRASGRYNAFIPKLARVYERYTQLLKQMDLVDFDDLLLLTVRPWREHPEVLTQYRERYHYLLVDEFQDTNVAQAELLRLLAGPRRNLCVVGDDDQSIYGWRGAAVSNILDFPQQYPGAKVIKLEQNYRSTNTILGAANGIIARNAHRHGKALWSDKPTGDAVRVIECDDEQSEGNVVLRLLQEHQIERHLDPEQMAVLFRSNHQSRVFEERLRGAHVPYRLVGAKSFYERREVRDAVAYLRLAHNPRDNLSLLRILNVPPRGLGDKAFELLKAETEARGGTMLERLRDPGLQARLGPAAAGGVRGFLHEYDGAVADLALPGDLTAKLQGYLDRIGYLNGLKRLYRDHEEALARRENVVELLTAAGEFQRRMRGPVTLQDFLEAYSLADDNDRIEEKTEEGHGVTLMTVHAAKGLEFGLVIIVGLEQGLFPHERTLADGDLDEERRLFYVAVTRAQQYLVLTYARQRLKYANRERVRPSQFLGELPKELLHRATQHDAFRPATRAEADDYLAQLKALTSSE